MSNTAPTDLQDCARQGIRPQVHHPGDRKRRRAASAVPILLGRFAEPNFRCDTRGNIALMGRRDVEHSPAYLDFTTRPLGPCETELLTTLLRPGTGGLETTRLPLLFCLGDDEDFPARRLGNRENLNDSPR
jgi:hypothetical protein